MIKTDIRYDTEHRSDNVRTVQTASETGFEHHHINLFISEPLECHDGRDLKERQVKMVKSIAPLLHERPHIFL